MNSAQTKDIPSLPKPTWIFLIDLKVGAVVGNGPAFSGSYNPSRVVWSRSNWGKELLVSRSALNIGTGFPSWVTKGIWSSM